MNSSFFFKGKVIEKQFASHFPNVTEASSEEDRLKHIDLTINHRVDVKSMKKRKRSDDSPDQSLHWIELKNVQGNKGWLYGDADLFAFETIHYWVIVSKQKLQEFIAEVCKDKIPCESPELYKLYTRKGRKDCIVLINTLDLCFLSEVVMKKEGVHYLEAPETSK